MRIVQAQSTLNGQWSYSTEKIKLVDPLVLVFGNRFLMEEPTIMEKIQAEFPYGHIVMGSTAGEIHNGTVRDETVVVTAIEFEKSTFVVKKANILEMGKNAEVLGEFLGRELDQKSLKHAFILSEGTHINGSALIHGIEKVFQGNAQLTGGMCGDGPRFQKTMVGYNESPKEGEVVLIGFFGECLDISYASYGGWIPFGPERIVTKSKGNVLYEIDNEPALNIYTKYLGDKAAELPQSSLFYPLNVTQEGNKESVVRTILGIDKEEKSMRLAGDIPEQSRAQLMMASVDGIALGAKEAAEQAMLGRDTKPQLAILVSCIGRKLVMDQRVEEEIEEVMEAIGDNIPLTGFYSYGEMAPISNKKGCLLHNQTMTLTLISEQ